MQKKGIYDWQEIKSIFLGSIILGFIFSAREWGYGSTNIGIGLTNLIQTTILSLIIILIYQTSHKLIAKKYHAHSTFRLWSLKRFWFSKNSKIENVNFFGKKFKTIKMGIISPLIFSLISNGLFRFATIGSSEVIAIEKKRIGKKFKHLTEYELAKIHLVGPLTILLLSLILHQFPGFDKIVTIGYTFSLFSMLPFSGLDGAKVFFGSLPLYIFGAGFIILTALLMQILSPLLTLILSIVSALILLVIFIQRNI
jgi:hypothetical protein